MARPWRLTSLKQFNQLYEAAIDKSDKAAMPAKRINNIVEHMTYAIYLYVQAGPHHIVHPYTLASTSPSSSSSSSARLYDYLP